MTATSASLFQAWDVLNKLELSGFACNILKAELFLFFCVFSKQPIIANNPVLLSPLCGVEEPEKKKTLIKDIFSQPLPHYLV